MGPMGLQDRGWETTIEAARANTLASSTAMVARLNEQIEQRYHSSFESWRVMVLAGKIDNTNPPAPPVGFELATSENGFAYPELGKSPVCAARTDIPEDVSKPLVQALPEPDHVRNVAKGDTMPVGSIVTDPEGRRWQKQSSVTPFGVAYFYARLG
jgi:hypothetical protein